ncbi:MAG TPA: hypothetical protein VKR58_15275 [Aquella sp.]|nr:hypothetical protein [Aquella sp.]
MKKISLKFWFISLALLVCLAKAEASKQSHCVNIEGDERYCFIVKNESPDLLTDVKISIDSSYLKDVHNYTVFHDYVVANIGNIKKSSETPQISTARPLEAHGSTYYATQNTWTIKYKRNDDVSYSAVFISTVLPSDLGGDLGCVVHIYPDNKIMLEAPHKQFTPQQANTYDPTKPDPTCVGDSVDDRFCFVVNNLTGDTLTNISVNVANEYQYEYGGQYHDYVGADIAELRDHIQTDNLLARPMLSWFYSATNYSSSIWTVNYRRNGLCYSANKFNNNISDVDMAHANPIRVTINPDGNGMIIKPDSGVSEPFVVSKVTCSSQK